MYYFAYGSNMSCRRLRQRVPSALVVSTGILHSHRLAFHKAGRDGSAKCDAAPGRQADDCVCGVVFQIDPADKARLDQAEGLGNGYEEKIITVHRSGALALTAFTYCATHIDPGLKPYTWYHEHVLRGANEQGLPAAYITAIASVESIEDPDPQRQYRELAIYA